MKSKNKITKEPLVLGALYQIQTTTPTREDIKIIKVPAKAVVMYLGPSEQVSADSDVWYSTILYKNKILVIWSGRLTKRVSK